MLAIESYCFGSMRIGGQDYHHDLKIIRGRVVSDWWRRQGHRLYPEDVSDILAAGVRVLIVGTGNPGLLQVTDEMRGAAAARGMELVALPTPEAVAAFNNMATREPNLAAAFHLTC